MSTLSRLPRRTTCHNFRNVVKEQRRSLQALEDTRKRREELRQEEEQAITATLNQTQLRRFRQLELQRALPMAFKRKEIADQLSLSEEQRSGILEIGQRVFPSPEEREKEQKQWDDQWDEVLGHGHVDEYVEARNKREAEQKEKYRKLRDQALDEIMVLLTDEQKEKWSEMVGAKFDFGPK